MSKVAFLSRFTPSLVDSETLEAIFVQREQLAAQLVESVRTSVQTRNKHYHLLIGPRGIGKTHLVSLVYYRVKQLLEPTNDLLIAWLHEEEWGVASYFDLLISTLRALKEEYDNEELSEKIQNLRTNSISEAEKGAEHLLLEVIGTKTLLIICENLDEIFRGIEEEGQKKLRALLQNNSKFTIIASSQSVFNGVSLRDSPFYGFFNNHSLKEFSLEDAVLLLTKIAELEQNQELATLIRTPRGHARIRAMHHLAAGNPRIYIIFFQFLTGESLDQLVTPVMQTLDDVTPYYQARMSFLAPQQRKIVEYLSDVRCAVPVSEIAKNNFISSQTTSSQLKKLSEFGYVKSFKSGRQSFYELCEPLMRMSLEVKKLRGRSIRLCVEFLRLWYSPTELYDKLEGLDTSTLSEREYLSCAIDEHVEKTHKEDPKVLAGIKDYHRYIENNEYEKALKVTDELIALRSNWTDWEKRARCFYNLGHKEKALAAVEKVAELVPEAPEAWIRAGIFHNGFGEYENIISDFNKMISTNPSDAAVWNKAGFALANRGFKKEAKEAYRKALLIQEKKELISASDWHHLILYLNNLFKFDKALSKAELALKKYPEHVGILIEYARSLDELKYYQEALSVCKEALRLDQNYAQAWFWYGRALIRHGLIDHAILSFEKALSIDKDLLYVWINLALSYSYIGDNYKALTINEQAILMFPASATPHSLKAVCQYRLGHLKEAFESLQKSLKIDSSVSNTWANQGVALSSLHKFEEAIDAFNKAKELLPKEPDFHILSNLAMALVSSGKKSIDSQFLEEALIKLNDEKGEDPSANIAIVRNLLIQFQDKKVWSKFIASWMEQFNRYKLLGSLGQGLARSIPALSISWITNEIARNWYEIWATLGGKYKELELPLRLLKTAVDYLEEEDQRALFQLAVEERSLLEQLLRA